MPARGTTVHSTLYIYSVGKEQLQPEDENERRNHKRHASLLAGFRSLRPTIHRLLKLLGLDVRKAASSKQERGRRYRRNGKPPTGSALAVIAKMGTFPLG